MRVPDLWPWENHPKERERKIGLLTEDVQDFIVAAQPSASENFSNGKLWLLQELDNRNKHRAIEPTLVAYSAFMPQFSCKEKSLSSSQTLRCTTALRSSTEGPPIRKAAQIWWQPCRLCFLGTTR